MVKYGMKLITVTEKVYIHGSIMHNGRTKMDLGRSFHDGLNFFLCHPPMN